MAASFLAAAQAPVTSSGPCRDIVIAYDGSVPAKAAALWYVHTLVRSGDCLHLVSVATKVSRPAAGQEGGRTSTEAARQREVVWQAGYSPQLAALAEELQAAGPEGMGVAKALLPPEGGVATTLVAYAAEMQPDLAVLGTRGLGAIQAAALALARLGSVSAHCLHRMRCPVLVAGQGAGAGAQQQEGKAVGVLKVMVGLDGSEASERALEWALAYALPDPSDELHLVTVVTPLPMPVSTGEAAEDFPLSSFGREYGSAAEEARRLLEHGTRVAQGHKVEGARVHCRELPPLGGASGVGESLARHAEEEGMGLVVLGSRGTGAGSRALAGALGLGSVTDYCAHHAYCPLLMVK